MSEQMSKTRLIEQIQKERQVLEAALAQVGEEQMTQPGVVDDWSVKDILAHISTWERSMVRWLGETLRGEVPEMLPPGLTWDDLDEWNERIYLENRDRPLAEVLTEFAHSYVRALEATRSAPEEDLLDPQRFPWREGKPLWVMVAANTCWHYAEHAKSIRAWLERETPQSRKGVD